jgi:hypothetical protein
MKIAVIAANGKSGRAFVTAALKAGHEIRSGYYGDNPFKNRPGLEALKCDATNPEHVHRLIQGCDAVVSLIGHVKGSPALVQTDAMKIIVETMQQQKIRRLISLTGTGVRMKGDNPSLLDILANRIIAFIDPERINDGIKHVEVIQASGLDWSVLRVLKLTSGAAGAFTLTDHGPAKLLTSRREVARAILKLLEQQRFIRACPVVSE